MKEIEIVPKAETLIIIGAPGSGKDTQAKFLVDALGYQEISTGKLIRNRANHDDDLKRVLDSGGLVDDDIVDDEIISVFALLPEDQPVILNGYPRTVDQANRLSLILEENNRKADRVIYIEVDDNILIERIGRRRECISCGFFTDLANSKCPDCGGALRARSDDKKEAAKKRIEIFHKKTEPVINYYKNLGALVLVCGNPSIGEVRDNIKKSI